MQQTANKLTLEQALAVLQQMYSQYKGTFQDHQIIQQAFTVIKSALEEPKVEIKADSIEEVTSN